LSCGKRTRADLPPGVPRRQFGARLTAVIALLSGRYRLSRCGGGSEGRGGRRSGRLPAWRVSSRPTVWPSVPYGRPCSAQGQVRVGQRRRQSLCGARPDRRGDLPGARAITAGLPRGGGGIRAPGKRTTIAAPRRPGGLGIYSVVL